MVRCSTLLRCGSVVTYICRYPRLHVYLFRFFFRTHSCLRLRCNHFSVFLHFSIPHFSYSILSNIYRNANDENEGQALPSSGGEEAQVADANAAIETRVTNIDIDLGAPSSSVVKYKTSYVEVLDAQEIGAMLSHGANLFMSDHRSIHRDTDIGACNWRWTLLWKSCPAR